MPDPIDLLLDELFGRDPAEGTTAAVVAVRRGEVVVERYGQRPADDLRPASTITDESTLLSWSIAKSITHAAVGILVGDGDLDPSAPAPVPEWSGTDRAGITLDHLLEMRSGLGFVEDYVDGAVSDCIEMLFSGEHPSFAHFAATRPSVAAPGSTFSYSSGTTNIVARIVGDVVVRRAGLDPDAGAEARSAAVADFLRTRLFGPAGMGSAVAEFDDAGDFVGSSYVYATARDFARFGELYRCGGVAPDGGRILPAGWVEHGTDAVSHDPESGFGYGRHWWRWPAFPGSFAAHGYQGQFVVVVPDAEIVIVHFGATDIAYSRPLTMRLARLAQALGDRR